MERCVDVLAVFGGLLVVLVIVVGSATLIFRRVSRKPLTLIEGKVFNVRVNKTVLGSVNKAAPLVHATTTLDLLVAEQTVPIKFEEAIDVNDDDVLRVAGLTRSKGLKILAYHNLTNSTYNETGNRGPFLRKAGCMTVVIGVPVFFMPDAIAIACIVPVVALSAWLLGLGYRYTNALKACLA